jgi:hypothetical protein
MTYAYPPYESLRLDRPADRVLRITMSRGKMNAMDLRLSAARMISSARMRSRTAEEDGENERGGLGGG